MALVLSGEGAASTGAAIVPELASELKIEGLTPGGEDGGSIAQMAWGPSGPAGEIRLYVGTIDRGISRFDYHPDGMLTNPVPVAPYPCLGLAFHHDPSLQGAGGAVLYLSEFNGVNTNAILRRLTDTDGDGVWGAAGDVNQELVNNIPLGAIPYGHHMNQMQIIGDSLHVGIGVSSDAGTNESAYTGTISWIEDLTLLSGDTTTANLAGLPVADFFLDPLPYTTEDPARLRVHSSGTRNPFGLAVDGDGRLWMTANQIDRPRTGTGETTVPQDQLFLAFEKADYAYQDGIPFQQRNPSHDWRVDAAVLDAGFFDPGLRAVSLTRDLPDPDYQAAFPAASSALPHGLGPHSSADGFDFYRGNGLALRWHQDAFVTRQSQQISAPLGPFEDVVAVDLNTGEVIRVASGFAGPLDVLADADGNLLVGEVGGGPTTRIYRIRPLDPIEGSHPFRWDRDGDGLWVDAHAWVMDLDGDGVVDDPPLHQRRVPHAWGTARYAVTIDRGGDPQVLLNRDVRVERVILGDRLLIKRVNTLTVDDRLSITTDGVLLGRGAVRGAVENGGVLAPGDPQSTATGVFEIEGDYLQSGRLEMEIGGAMAPAYDRLEVKGEASLGGSVRLSFTGGFLPRDCDHFDLVVADAIHDQGFALEQPEGTSLVVRVVDAGGGRQALRASTRLLTALEGSVNCGVGPVADVLRVNGSAGDAERVVSVPRDGPIEITLAASPSGPGSAFYVLWVWRGDLPSPDGVELVVLGRALGLTAGPTPSQPGLSPQPFRCYRPGSLGREPCGDVLTLTGPAAVPWSLSHPGLPRPAAFTLQGLVQDAGASNTLGVSVTNGVRLTIE